MKNKVYTIYKVDNLTLNESYVSASHGIRKNDHFKIINKNILEKTNGCKIQKNILCIVNNKKELRDTLELYKKSYIVFDIHEKIKIKDNNGNDIFVYRDDILYRRYKENRSNIKQNDYILVKDIDGNVKRILKTSEEYLSGKYVGIRKKFNKEKRKTGLDCIRQEQFNNKMKIKYPDFHYSFRYIKEGFLIKDFCEHGDLKINKGIFDYIYNNSKVKIYCDKCRENYFKNTLQTKEDIENNRKYFEIISNYGKNTKYFNEEFIKIRFPEIYLSIYNYINVKNWAEKIYCFRNKIKEIPKCTFDNCNNIVDFSITAKHYNSYCNKHKYAFNISKGENELKKYIEDNYKGEIVLNDRKILNGKELDIYVPNLNLAFEYNGLYNHSILFKDKDYHYNKWKICNDNKINLITIWEDDWFFKNDLIKSIIDNKLKINNKIYARETNIRLISSNDSKIFLENNHIQRFCPSSIRLGLFHKDELVSLMTFGKKRSIMKSFSKSDEYELLRFCNKRNINVIGGASKLFTYFLKNYNPKYVISYSSCEYSNGNLYKILNFKNIGHNIGYWWYKDGIKYHRSNFMKHKLINEGYDKEKTEDEIMISRGYIKIYNSGNIKWIYENNT